LYDRHAGDLLAFLRRMTGDAGASEELLQETFMRAVRAAGRFPRDAERPWLFRVAANLAASHLRRRRLIAFVRLSEVVQPDERGGFDPESHQVRAALRSIPHDQAIALTLHLHSGFSRREIAELLHTSEDTIKSRLGRGRRNFAAAYRRLERGLAR
jgi:RNA polymerase sigma-70 factor (ECF subfamily)